MKRAPVIILLCLFGAGLTGCGASSLFSNERAVVTPYDANMLWNLKQGREYVAQGRFELAKEHFLFALASCSDEASRELITHELNAVELMIKTQR